MKTLAISLHRLGDLIMHAHVLKAFQMKTGHSLSLLTHPFYKQIDFLFPFISNIYLFERDLCQKSIGENIYNKSWPFIHIQEIIENINSEKFDQIVDLSQSETSARWMSFLNSPQKIGVAYGSDLQQKTHCSDNSWIRYLHANAQSKIHFVDLFKKSLNLPLDPLPQALEKKIRPNRILFQTLTSDVKKNWTTVKWIELFHKMLKFYPQFEFQILSSPSEYVRLNSEFSNLSKTIPIVVTTIEETFELLKNSRMLVTLDTAIKHLATWTGTPIVELALGSSNPYETGAYQEGAIILKSNVPCTPCRHSSSCSQSTFLCQDELSVDSVFAAMQLQLQSHNETLHANISENIILSFLEGKNNHQRLTPIHYVHSSPEGWWSCSSILNLKKREDYERRSKQSIEIDY